MESGLVQVASEDHLCLVRRDILCQVEGGVSCPALVPGRRRHHGRFPRCRGALGSHPSGACQASVCQREQRNMRCRACHRRQENADLRGKPHHPPPKQKNPLADEREWVLIALGSVQKWRDLAHPLPCGSQALYSAQTTAYTTCLVGTPGGDALDNSRPVIHELSTLYKMKLLQPLLLFTTYNCRGQVVTDDQ